MNIIRSRFIAQTFLLVACFVTAQACGQQSGKEITDDLKPILDCQTISLLNFPIGKFPFDESIENLLGGIDDVPTGTKRKVQLQTEYFQKVSEGLAKAGAIDVNVIGRLGTLVVQDRLIAVRCKNEAAAEAVSKRINRIHIGFYGNVVKENLVLLGWDDALMRLPRIEDHQLLSIARSLDQVRESPIRMAFTLSPDQKKALIAGDGKQWGDGTAASVNNFLHMSVGLDVVGKRLAVHLQAIDNDSSAAIASMASGSLERVASSKDISRNLPLLSKWLRSLELSVSDDKAVLKIEGAPFDTMVKALSQPFLQILKRQKFSEKTARAREIAVGLLKYEEKHGSFPPAYTVDEKGNPMHSWRVLILPFINQRNLHRLFRMDEPWNSPHNLEVAENSPVNYMINDGEVVDGILHTRILAMVSDHSTIRLKPVKINQIVDGTVNTISIAIGSREQAVPWTKPVDVQGTPAEIAASMLAANPDGFWVATCDSGVHFVTSESDKEKLAWAIQIDDGKLLSPNGDRLAEALAGRIAPDPMYDPADIIPHWWTDYLIPVPFVKAAKSK